MMRLIIILSALLSSGLTFSQDAHMWDSQYGTRAQLLGGLVVGASSDLSSTYYNPAWLALERKPSILLSTRAAELYNLKEKNGFGAGTEPNDTRLVASPSFFGGKFTTNIADDKVAIAGTYLQKTQFRYSASGIIIDENPAPPPAGSLWF
ncbi:MAG: hypothetical protein GY780_16040, partial [bacterium]|nr:hypothetical protein [bacterium]